jgi:flagellar motor switch protein FliN
LLASLTGANAPDQTSGTPAGASPAPAAPAPDPNAASETILPDQAMIDELLKQAEFEDPSNPAAGAAAAAVVSADSANAPTEPFEMPNFQQVMADAQVSSIDLLRDVELNVKIELGRSRMLVEDVLKLGEGSVVELDKLAGDPVDVFVNDRLVARGEVLVLNENFCVRVNEIVAGMKDEGV